MTASARLGWRFERRAEPTAAGWLVALGLAALANTAVKATPLIFTGLATALAFRAGLWNIGAEEQVFAGAMFAFWCTHALGATPAALQIPLILVTAMIGGAFLTVGSSARFVPDMTAGRGWLALVIVIAGIWRPGYMLTAALAFSFLDALQLQIQGVGIDLPHQILLALTYIVAILSLALMRRNAKAPAMLGTPYIHDQ